MGPKSAEKLTYRQFVHTGKVVLQSQKMVGGSRQDTAPVHQTGMCGPVLVLSRVSKAWQCGVASACAPCFDGAVWLLLVATRG
ncbi:hypothetical protein CGRA01v4_01183 [Colletotrichum graminicola]|nr:hypothetical protein CGRA01v4_01183 [Colletotrichum graminicola]